MGNELEMIQNLADMLVLNEMQSFSATQLAERFTTEQEKHRYDPVVGNVTGVLQKMAAKEPNRHVSNVELYDLYNKFARLNPETKFKEIFADLLPASDQQDKDFSDHISRSRFPYNDVPRDIGELKQEALEVDEWETAVGQPVEAFGIMKFDKASLANTVSHDPKLVRAGANLVKTQLEAIGLQDVRAELKYAVKNCMLYLASFPTTRGKAYVNVPVSLKDSDVELPVIFADTTGKRTYALTNDGIRNLLFDLDDIRDEIEATAAQRQRQDMTSDFRDLTRKGSIEVDETDTYRQDTPTTKPSQVHPELIDVENILENSVIQAESRHSEKTINSGRAALDRELAKFGFKNSRIRFAGDNPRGMSFDAALNTGRGKVEITIPVEVVASNTLLPSHFVADDGQIHDFTHDEISSIVEHVEPSESVPYTADLVNMDYNSVRKIIHQAAFTHDHGRAKEALSLVQAKFGTEAHGACVNDYQSWMEQASQDFGQRCTGCSFYRPRGTKYATSTHDYCNLLHTKCANVTKKQGICVRAHLDFDKVRDDSYKGSIMTNKIHLT